MDKITQIRREIERQAESIKNATGDYAEGRRLEQRNILAFLDTLEQEKDMDLEKEIDKTVNECTDGYDFDWDKFARHFYELGKNAK